MERKKMSSGTIYILGLIIIYTGAGDTAGLNKQDIYIAGFFPLSLNVSEGAVGRGVMPAVQLALHHINNNTHLHNVLINYKLNISYEDTKCSAADGMKVFFDMVHNPPPKLMLFGDACSKVTDPIAKASKYWQIVQLSYADMDPMFSKSTHPNLFRIVPSENEFNGPRLALLKKFNWTRVGTLYQNQPRFSLAHNRLVADMEDIGIQVVAAQSFADDIHMQLLKLKEKDVRVILGNFNETWARRIFCVAYQEGLYGRKYQWLIVAAYSPHWWRKRDVDCSVEQVERALKGAFLMDLQPLSSSDDITVSGMNAKRYKEQYDVVNFGSYSRFHGYAYDGIWAIALALNNITAYLPPKFSYKKYPLKFFHYHSDIWERALVHSLEATNFIGVTGHVKFRDNGRKGTVLIKQFQAFKTVNAEVKVGEFDGVTQTMSLNSVGWKIVWNGKHPPKDRTFQTIERTRVSITLFAAMTTVSSIGILLACFFLAINIKFRHQRYIKMSSPNLNNLIILGCIVTYSSVIILGLDSRLASEESFPYICTARAWALMAGFTLAFGSMFSKTWRVHSIFTNVKLNKKVIKDMQLLVVVGILFAIDMAIMLTWQIIDPFYRETKQLEPYVDPTNEDLQIIPENEYCKSQYMNYFMGLIYAYKGLLMLFGCFLAWETRHVSIPALNDSKYIGMSVYNSVMMCVLGAPLSHVLSDQKDASFLIISVFIIFCTTATLCLVFLPKIIELKRNPKGTVEKRLRATIKPPFGSLASSSGGGFGSGVGGGSSTGMSGNRRASATSIYENELRLAKQDNQKIRKQIRELDSEIQALAKLLGKDGEAILQDVLMDSLRLPKSEFKKEDTDVSSLYSLNSEDAESMEEYERSKKTKTKAAGQLQFQTAGLLTSAAKTLLFTSETKEEEKKMQSTENDEGKKEGNLDIENEEDGIGTEVKTMKKEFQRQRSKSMIPPPLGLDSEDGSRKKINNKKRLSSASESQIENNNLLNSLLKESNDFNIKNLKNNLYSSYTTNTGKKLKSPTAPKISTHFTLLKDDKDEEFISVTREEDPLRPRLGHHMEGNNIDGDEEADEEEDSNNQNEILFYNSDPLKTENNNNASFIDLKAADHMEDEIREDEDEDNTYSNRMSKKSTSLTQINNNMNRAHHRRCPSITTTVPLATLSSSSTIITSTRTSSSLMGRRKDPSRQSVTLTSEKEDLKLKYRSMSVPKRLDKNNINEINLDVSLLPIFHKIIEQSRTRSLRDNSTKRSNTSIHHHYSKSSSFMVSCPNILIKCDIVEYL